MKLNSNNESSENNEHTASQAKKPRPLWSLVKELFDFSGDEKTSVAKKRYVCPPSISQQFAWQAYDSENRVFELQDGRSLALVYELIPLPTEGQSEAYLAEIADMIAHLLAQDYFPQYYLKESPWILQFYVSDDNDLWPVYDAYVAGIHDALKASCFSQVYFHLLKKHFDYFMQKAGLFVDPLTDQMQYGRLRRVRLVIYRNLHPGARLEKGQTPLSELISTAEKLEEYFKGANIQFRRLDDQAFHAWLFKWLSPAPSGFENANDYLSQVKFPEKTAQATLHFDLVQSVFSSEPKSDEKQGIWYFDQMPHRFLPLVGFTEIPLNGQISAERLITASDRSPKRYAPLDQLPIGSVFHMTIVLQHQDFQMQRASRIIKKARKSMEEDATLAAFEAEKARRMVAQGNHIFPVAMGIYLRADHEKALELQQYGVTAKVSAKMHLKTLKMGEDKRQLDRYIRFLPMNYQFQYDAKYLMQSRLLSLKQIAATVPLYGRTRGSEHPLFLFTNRLGEPIFFDPFAERVSNAHMLILGTTGSGKSNLSAYLLMQLIAMRLPRMVVVDAGGSFRYVMQFAKRLGLRVNAIEITMERPSYTLNPFTETRAMLSQVAAIEALNQKLSEYEAQLQQKIEETAQVASVAEQSGAADDKENRDYLMEFVTAATLMITGAEQKEVEALDRQDRYLILEAIKKAARQAIALGFDQMIPEDLVKALTDMASLANQSGLTADGAIAVRLNKMAHGLKAFIDMPLNAMYFNQRGAGLPEADITYFEMGLFKDDKPENEAPRALAFIQLMNDSMTKAEKHKNEGRPFVFYGDECHIVTSKPLTAASVVQATKMGRKNDFWIWLATQNVSDFPKAATKAVSMIEYKMILWCDQKEQAQIQEFVQLTKTQQNTLKTLTKAKGKYVEVMLISNHSTYLFRNIPPREILYLAATEGEENAKRQALMARFDCDAVEASFLMAQAARGENYDLTAVRNLLTGFSDTPMTENENREAGALDRLSEKFHSKVSDHAAI